MPLDAQAETEDLNNTARMNRLRWQCRRGQLELDNILLTFLEQGLDTLDEINMVLFDRLLRESDADLSDWFLARTSPVNPAYRQLVTHILSVLQKNVSPIS